MLQTALRNKKGVTLVEVMIALVILLVVFMGLIQASLLTIENTATTALRDEAVRLATDTVTVLKASPFTDLDRDGVADPTANIPARFTIRICSTGDATQQANAAALGINTVRSSRNLTSNYDIRVTVEKMDDDNKQATVLVRWDWKERTVAGGNPYSHQAVALLRR